MTNSNQRKTGPYFAGTFFVMLTLVNSLAASGQVVPPDVAIAGKSQPEWNVEISKWVMRFPDDRNPLLDETGELAHLGDQGPVFFLNTTFGGPTVTRDVTVRDDQHLFLGILNSIFWVTVEGETEAGLRAEAAALVELTDSLHLEIDGVATPEAELFMHRQPSPPGMYDLFVPENAIFELPAGTFPAVTDGYSVMLEPLTQGDHTVAFGGTDFSDPDNPYSVSAIYNVHVVPEPSGVVHCLGVGLFILGLRRRLS